MDAKYAGERALMASAVPYTIVRPGGLRSGGAAPEPLVFGQGDGDIVNGGRAIDRSDVARVVLDAIAVGPRNVTFEVVAAAPSAASGATPATAGAGALGSPAVQAALRGLNPDARV